MGRTDLISFGGTVTPSASEAATESETAFDFGGTVERFAAGLAEAGVLVTAGRIADSLDADA